MLVNISIYFTSNILETEQLENVYKYVNMTSPKIYTGKQPTDYSFYLTPKRTPKTNSLEEHQPRHSKTLDNYIQKNSLFLST